mgnify:CR=1 FL=1
MAAAESTKAERASRRLPRVANIVSDPIRLVEERAVAQGLGYKCKGLRASPGAAIVSTRKSLLSGGGLVECAQLERLAARLLHHSVVNVDDESSGMRHCLGYVFAEFMTRRSRGDERFPCGAARASRQRIAA